jgi:hypothetical protein
MNRTFFRTLLVSCLASAAALPVAGAQAAPDLGLTRASPDEIARVHGLTADYVRTPHGYFHVSCVQHVDQSESLEADGSIRRADGLVRQVAACRYPHFLKSGVRVEASEGATHMPDTYNGYLQLVSATLASGTNELIATMTVPGNPTNKSGQTLYFFPGLEDASHVVTILQPVLGWDGYGANNWTIASWNCCKSGTTYVGNNVVVQPGDVILGTMIHTTGQNWTVTAVDQTRTTLPAAILSTKSYSQVFNWVFAGALETYGVRNCAQFPPRGPIRFTAIQAFVSGKLVSKPTWNIEPGTDPQTACTGAAIVNPKTVTISY